MARFLKWDIPSIAFIATIIVCASCIVFLAEPDISSKARIVFIILAIASFFSGLSLILQLKERRKETNHHR
jgi:hypothetical protein